MRRRSFLVGAFAASIDWSVNLKNSIAEAIFDLNLIRTFESDKCISGELFIDRKFLCHTLELPWRQNKTDHSSIPGGEYPGFLRYDKPDKWHWRVQLEDTEPRTGVQIHIGSYTNDATGCILLGESVENQIAFLSGSAKAYKKFKNAFYGTEDPIMTPDKAIHLRIRSNIKPTEFILRDDGGEDAIYRQQGTDWLLYSQFMNGRLVWNELQRTSEHVVFQGVPGSGVWQNKQIRLPLHGGPYFEVKKKGRSDWAIFAQGTRVIRRDLTAEM